MTTTAFTLQAQLELPFDRALAATRDALAHNGFGIITEIDMSATLKSKLGVDTPPQVILGACRPQLAHQALQASPSVAALLPCNVVVRAQGGSTTLVEALDPAVLSTLIEEPALRVVATEARERLLASLEQLDRESAKEEH